MAPRRRAFSSAACNARIAAGWTKPHHHVVGTADRVEPGTVDERQIHRRQRTFADNHRMHELHRHVLRVGGERALAESQQPPAAQKALGHALARGREPRRLAGEERARQLRCATCKSALDGVGESTGRQSWHSSRRQQIRGRASPTSMSTTRLPP